MTAGGNAHDHIRQSQRGWRESIGGTDDGGGNRSSSRFQTEWRLLHAIHTESARGASRHVRRPLIYKLATAVANLYRKSCKTLYDDASSVNVDLLEVRHGLLLLRAAQ